MTTQVFNDSDRSKQNAAFGGVFGVRRFLLNAALFALIVGAAVFVALRLWSANLVAAPQNLNRASVAAARSRLELARKQAIQEEFDNALTNLTQYSFVDWKLDYDLGKRKNFLDIQVRNPLRYHEASFVVRFDGNTVYLLREGRLAEKQLFSHEVQIPPVAPGGVLKMRVYCPTPVTTQAIGKAGWFQDWLGLNQLVVVEPPIDAPSVSFVFYKETFAAVK